MALMYLIVDLGGRNDFRFSRFSALRTGASRVVGSRVLESYTFECSYALSDFDYRIYYGLLASTSYYSASYNIYSGSLTVHCTMDVANPCVKTVWIYSYTGSMEKFRIPVAAKSLKVEAYGAQGGSVMSSGTSTGGRGGLMICSLEVSDILSRTLYVAVGGAGTGYSNTTRPNYGGWNGGGDSVSTVSVGCQSGSGGGASDVRLVNMTDANSLDTRLVVGGGGGGGGGSGGEGGTCATTGGNGGGITGMSGTGNGGSLGGEGGGAGRGGVGESPGGQTGLYGQGGVATTTPCLSGLCIGGGMFDI